LKHGDIFLQRLGISRFPISRGMDDGQKNRGEKERKMKTFRRQEDIDKILRKNRSSSQASKTTELGKQFIKFIESPSIQTQSM
jgi:hypothetical protein